MAKGNLPALVVWFYGLPGSGKSTISRGVLQAVKARSKDVDISLISMDNIRKKIFPDPTYSDQERDAAYRCFVLIGSLLSSSGITVLLDGTGHKRKWRELARKECPNFVEVYVKCSVEVCIQRETQRNGEGDVRKKLYLDALDRLSSGKKIEGLGKVPGVDEAFEESPAPEVILDSTQAEPEALIREALLKLSKFAPQIFSTK